MKQDDNQNFSVDEIIDETRSGGDEDSFDEFQEEYEEIPQEPKVAEDKKKKKKKHSFFGRKNQTPDFDENEDAYYGIEVKSLNELRKGFDATGEIHTEDNTFAELFDDTLPSLDDEVERNFQRIQRERRRRVAEAVETAGVSVDDVADELGIIAPMPVTSFGADPYTKQHGITSSADRPEDESQFQRAMMQSAENQTMEIKLNVLNDTVELQKNQNIPAVDEATVAKILENAARSEAANKAEKPAFSGEDIESFTQETEEASPPPEKSGVSQDTNMYLDIPPEAVSTFPTVDILEHYREKTVPVHIVNIDVLQSSILTESAEYQKKESPKKAAPFDRFIAKFNSQEETDSAESIDDYTSPADAKSISHELKSNMQQLSARLLVTGLSTVVLFFCTVIFEGMFQNADPKNNPIAYLIITLALISVCVGFCYKSILNGIKNLLRFNANSDSAAAVAVIAVLVQTLVGFLFQGAIAGGTIHLYGLLAGVILFLNALGKLTMLRRIHSNFRFVTAREQKYAVKIYGDYNTSLKMAKDCVAEAPVIAYQQKTAFLKRFLQLSYESDPSETASQGLAPIGLILSLVLCLVSLFVTKDIYTAITAFAASSCICVAVSNMLAINLPISKLCKRARRAGAMLTGYDAVDELSKTNAVMMDASDLFPTGTVVLDGVKTFGTANPDSVMLMATALCKGVGGTLTDVFEQVTEENEGELPKVGNMVLEEEYGVSGSVQGHRVLVGNRTLLMNHHIDPPEREDVVKYTAGGKKVVFIAVDDRLEAMLLLTYKADRRKKIELQRMEANGISLILRSADANITGNMVGKLFEISPSSVSILTPDLGETYEKLAHEEVPRADALVATKGRIESMMHVTSACVSEKKVLSLVVALQNIGVILGFVLVAFLVCFSGIKQLTAVAIMLYELFWLAVLLLLPRIKKPF
ncbi:MAG: hypothetical protein RSC76_01560 [Oscillospiraceae bacterium]